MLDRLRPYAEVWGGTGMAGYEQDGRRYRIDGRPVDGDDPPPRVRAPVSDEVAEKRRANLAKARAARKAKAAGTSVEVAPIEDGFAAKSDDELRALVEIAGGMWSDREAAISELTEQS